MKKETKERQNQSQIDNYLAIGPVKLGPWTSHIWRTDPRHLCFLLSRYKFCSKLLAGKKNVLEVGCGDAFGMPIVLQSVETVHGVDFEPLVIEDARLRLESEGLVGCSFSVVDMTNKSLERKFDAAYSLDVIEHIPPELEEAFIENICASLSSQAVCVIGTPNITASQYASPASAEGHINLKSAESLKQLLLKYFDNVFIFSMNDEVVHTGFYPMANYLMALATGPKNSNL